MKIQDYCDTVDGALRLKTPLSTFCRGNIVTDDDDMKRQLDLLVRCGQGRVPLTICGEKGSGKDRIAQYAHEFMIIQQSIEQHGSIRKAAAALKTSHATLSRKITEYHLLPPESERTLK